MRSRKRRWAMWGAAALMVLLCAVTVFAGEGEAAYEPNMYATFWALVPPIVAIALALITKEVYSSLFIGILVGAVFYSNFSFEGTVTQIFQGGIISVLSDSYNVGILVFLVILGIMVCLMNNAGGSAAFGRWAGEHIKSRVGAQLATILLGVLIFIDDYFNCLTVGSVMRPVTDKQQISRAKLAYLIDATAAPVCIIAPISSWAAAVSGFVEGEDGLSLFVRAIPYNFYALLTIVMMVGMVLMKVEFGSMAVHEKNAMQGDLYTTPGRPYASEETEKENMKGKVIDLVIPILCLVICCVIGMIYTGGFFEGAGFVEAFSQSDASVGLALGSFFGLVITVILYIARRVLSFRECMACIPEGFKANGSGYSDPYLCMDAEGHDRQSGCGRVCGKSGAVRGVRIYEPASGYYLFSWMRSGVCHRNFMGNLWYSDSYCGFSVCKFQSTAHDHFHFRLYGRSCLR